MSDNQTAKRQLRRAARGIAAFSNCEATNYCGPVNSQTNSVVRAFVTPAQAGVQETYERAWIPAGAGLTIVAVPFDEPFKGH